MLNLTSTLALQKITEFAHVPAVGYAYVEPKEKNKHQFASTALTFGKRDTQSTDTDKTIVNDNTRFPASSLSKIVFTYLVLQLVKEGHITLDEALHNILPYERFKVDGEYPEKAKQLTARQVLSHTAGLPNFGPSLSSTLSFDAESKLGKKYSYSGEAFLYLQRVIEKKMGKDLEALAKAYVFTPLRMERSTFSPQPNDTNIVKVHTELGKPTPIYVGDPAVNAAGSLLTTAQDFSKFMSAWLERMDDPVFKQAFESKDPNVFPTCGLGWHLYRNKDETIVYQYGENPNTRSFVALNVKNKKGAAFFTNSENGMSIANQVMNSPDLAPIGNMQDIFRYMHYSQSDEPGWKETIVGKIAEDQGNFGKARECFEKALKLAPEDKSKQRRLEWFNAAHQLTSEKKITPLKTFEGMYTNAYNDEIVMSVSREGGLIYKEFGNEIKLVRVSETEFLPEKDQSFKVRFDGDQMIISFIHGGCDKFLSKRPLLKSQEASTSYTVIAKSLGHQPHLIVQTEHSDTRAAPPPEEERLATAKPAELEQKVSHLWNRKKRN